MTRGTSGAVGVTAASGFRAAGVVAGLKNSGKPDVAVVVNDGPLQSAAGVFTANRVKAAPVIWTQQCLAKPDAATSQMRAVVLNSGGANACTGAQGFADTRETAEHAAELLDCDPTRVGVCSTGLIGTPLPMDLLLPGVDAALANLSPDGGSAAAHAIMTTDTHAKTAVARTGLVTTGGMAKGAGMLAPELATMLSVITTDAIADSATLARTLSRAAELSFNRVDSDGCMSTNDTVLLLASGASGHELTEPQLLDAVTEVAQDLALQLIGDAEGAGKEIRIEVIGAESEGDAVAAARGVARSNLFKCAVHGEDPNWGRILSAVGTTDARFDPNRIDVAVNGVWVCRGGGVGEDRNLVDMSGREVHVLIDLHNGNASATVWTNDLTADYVHENSAYSS
ncbi:MAG: bifunctional glutamate N-acetyltransferase/amino-acid acetyltransferase ArgJ [Candidatus Nanopelagicales bacterium]|nr:bifunctional glutamate N-acetyltransferase/amino-acid acetyltransferase ArgJ [Candidatus Nanopelagicales bacterium]